MDYDGNCQVESIQFRIVEGSYSCHPLFGRYASLTVFMDVEPGEQMRRISLRNGEAMAEMFRTASAGCVINSTNPIIPKAEIL